jgi:hypothetical protein
VSALLAPHPQSASAPEDFMKDLLTAVGPTFSCTASKCEKEGPQ